MYSSIQYLLDPFVVCVLLTAIAFIVIWMRDRQFRRPLLLVAVPFGALVVICTPAFAWLLAASLEWPSPPLETRPAECEAIVVLSGYARPEGYGQPEPELAEDTYSRCLQAARLYRQGPPCLVIASGGTVSDGESQVILGRVMRQTLEQQGIARSDLLTEEVSQNTYENASETAKLLHNRGVRRIVLVTDAMCLRRAEQCFVAQGFQVTSAGCRYRAKRFRWSPSNFVPNPSAATLAARVVHEWVGIAWYACTGKT